MPHLLYLWRAERDPALPGAEIQRQLDAGEDFAGLVDLPIREMLDQLNRSFSGSKETAGQVIWVCGEERFRATWAWQFLRLESEQLSDEHRDHFFELARAFGCSIYDPQLNLTMK